MLKNKFQKKMINFVFAALILFSKDGLQANWSAPVAISTIPSSSPKIIVDAFGNAIAIWQGFDGSNYIIQAATMPMGGNWSSSINLSLKGYDANYPAIACDGLGNAIALWSRFDGLNSSIQCATLSASGNWSSVSNISLSGQNANLPSIAYSSSQESLGIAVGIWQQFNGNQFGIKGAIYTTQGVWSNPDYVSSEGEDTLVPVIVVDSSGNATAIWERFNGSFFVLQSAQLVANQWVNEVTLSKSVGNAINPSIASDSFGNVLVVWSEFDGSHYLIKSSNLPFKGTWTAPETISDIGQDSYSPMVAMNPNGDAVIIWIQFNGIRNIVHTSSKTFEGNWSASINLSSEGDDAIAASIALDPLGNSQAVWSVNHGKNTDIQVASSTKGERWTKPINISSSSKNANFPVIAVDSLGNAIAIWIESNGTINILKGSKALFNGYTNSEK